jgi:hypothetical protein
MDLPPENILRHYDLALYSHQRYIFVICLDGTLLQLPPTAQTTSVGSWCG